MQLTLRICSDLHLDHYSLYKKPCNRFSSDLINEFYFLPVMEDERDQVLIIAGDFLSPHHANKWVEFTKELSQRFSRVLLVMGNHDYWKADWITGPTDLQAIFDDNGLYNFEVLDDEAIIINGFAIFGSSLWAGFDNANQEIMATAYRYMNDYRYMKDGGQDLSPNDTLTRHRTHVINLQKFSDSHKDYKKVVITHHAPSLKSIHPDYINDDLSHAYCTDLDDLIKEINPLVWVHGHVHNHQDYMIGGECDTRVIANPAGYFHEKSVGYKNDFTINLEDKD